MPTADAMSNMLSAPARQGRGEETRRKLLHAAVACLGANGFDGTTVDALMRATGVSRGSVLHQFPNRLELMAATAGHAMEEMIADTVSRFEALGRPTDRLEQLPDLMWEVQKSRPAIALIEVLLASRWDRDLAQRLTPIAEQIEVQIDALLGDLADQTDLGDRLGFLTWGRLLIAGMRGLAIELMLQPDRDMILRALEALKQQHRLQVAGWLA